MFRSQSEMMTSQFNRVAVRPLRPLDSAGSGFIPLPRRSVLALAGGAGLAGLIPGPAKGEIRVDINQGILDPLPIAVPEFFPGAETNIELARQIPAVIASNLLRSGLFRPITGSNFIQSPEALQAGPDFASWRTYQAQALVSGRVDSEADGRTRVEFRLWDAVAETQLVGLALSSDQDRWRRIAHQISDAIFRRVTGDEGYFDTRIVYISETGPANQRTKRLAMMDQDGEGHRFLTDGSVLVLTPRFSPRVQQITYLAYYNRKPRVYLFDIESGRQEVLGDFPNMSFAPRFSPDGSRVIMSMADSGNSDVFTMDLPTRQLRRLTREPGIETSPSYSPDGRRVCFESDRGGSQQIYVMNADGSQPTRISFGEGRYAGPVWSPRGDLIAFTKIFRGRFYIGVMRPDGNGEKLLADAFHVEGPTWAPNGRAIMYFTQSPTGENGAQVVRLAAIDLTGQHGWQVSTPLDGSDPAWSPLLP